MTGTSSGYRQEADRLRHILYKLQRMDKAAGGGPTDVLPISAISAVQFDQADIATHAFPMIAAACA
jgi:hypothetical protein